MTIYIRRRPDRLVRASGEALCYRLQADAARLPLPDDSIDLIMVSPPYWGQRSYTDDGRHYPGQLGSEATWEAYLKALLDCTAEWVRVLKPSGSLFVNLDDKYGPRKSLLNLPGRYAIGCTDQLGLIQRADIIWSKTNGLPNAAKDRVARRHELLLHFTRQPSYYADLDEIREPYLEPDRKRADVFGGRSSSRGVRHAGASVPTGPSHSGGKPPGSVWNIPTTALVTPQYRTTGDTWLAGDRDAWQWLAAGGPDRSLLPRDDRRAEVRTAPRHEAAYPPELCRRVILGWCPPGGTVLDPMGGAGTTALAASVLGRTGITSDLSMDYARLSRWRAADPKQRQKVLRWVVTSS